MSHNINISNITDYSFLQPASDSSQGVTTAWVDVSGSQITYTPTENSDFIIYEFCFLQSQDPSESSTNYMVAYYKFLYSDNNGSTWSELSNSRNFIGGLDPSLIRIRGLYNIKHCIPYWSNSARIFKLQVKKPSNTYATTLHINAGFYDDTGLLSDDRYIRPIVSCYSVTS